MQEVDIIEGRDDAGGGQYRTEGCYRRRAL